MSHLDVRNAALKPLYDLILSGGLIGIDGALTAENLSLPNDDFDPSGMGSFVTFDVIGDTYGSLGQGATSSDILNPIAQVSVYCTAGNKGTKDIRSREMVDSILGVYTNNSTTNYGNITLEITSGSINAPRNNGAWFVIDITINFETYLDR